MGHQDPPSRVMARCKRRWEIILTALCVGTWERHTELSRGAWHRRSDMFHINPHSHSPSTAPLMPPPLRLQPSSGSIYIFPIPGIQGWGVTRVDKGSDERGAWKRTGWVFWNKGTARIQVILGRGMASRGTSLQVSYVWAIVPSQSHQGSDLGQPQDDCTLLLPGVAIPLDRRTWGKPSAEMEKLPPNSV